MGGALAPPPVVDVLRREDVEDRIRSARAEIDVLARTLAEAVAEADALEAQVGATFDPQTYQFVALRLARFLDGLRAEVNAEMATLVTASEGQHRRRVAAGPSPFAHLAQERAEVKVTEPVVTTPVVTTPAESLVAVAPLVAVAEVDPPVGETDAALEAQFWADLDRERSRSHLWRTVRSVSLQATAVVLVLTAVLIRIG